MKILLVKDKYNVADEIANAIRNENYDLDVCFDENNALGFVQSLEYDLVVLDIMFAGNRALDIIKQIRSDNIVIPIFVLATRISVEERIKWLDNGADDYMQKPFENEELFAKLRALCRRPCNFYENVLCYDDISLNVERREIKCLSTGQSVATGQKETALLECMMKYKNQVFTREQLTLKAWQYDSNAEYNNIEVYISFIRKKLKSVGSQVQIKAIRGIGYKLE